LSRVNRCLVCTVGLQPDSIMLTVICDKLLSYFQAIPQIKTNVLLIRCLIKEILTTVMPINIVEDVRIRATYTHRKKIPITEGFVEVKDGGKWRQICNEEWSEMNSRVICGMYGFPSEKPFNLRPYK
ncbi:hypothetical protein GOODEAATRI_018711, partial [Goodea atripinnis]